MSQHHHGRVRTPSRRAGRRNERAVFRRACRCRSQPGGHATRRRGQLGQLADLLLGKMVTLVLAAVALLLGIATFVVLAGGAPLGVRPNVVFAHGARQPRRAAAARRGAGRAADAGLGGAAARLGRIAAACAPRAAVQRGGRDARNRRGGVRHVLLRPRHPVLVQRPGAHRACRKACRSAAATSRSIATTSVPTRSAWPTTSPAPAALLADDPNAFGRDACRADRAARADRGGDLRAGDRAGDGLGRADGGPRRRARRRPGRREQARAATWRCSAARTARACARWCS